MNKVYKGDSFWFYDFVRESFLMQYMKTPTAKIYEESNNSLFELIVDVAFIKRIENKL